MTENFSSIGRTGMIYRQIRDAFMFLVPLIALSPGATAYAADDHPFYTSYHSNGHVCGADNYNLTLAPGYINWLECEHQAYTFLKQEEDQLILRIAPSATCLRPYVEVMKITKIKPRWPGDVSVYAIKDYETYDKYLKEERHSECFFQRDDAP